MMTVLLKKVVHFFENLVQIPTLTQISQNTVPLEVRRVLLAVLDFLVQKRG